jgi:ubiquinone/menaquinone biosynthesis C-methylase UbiE
MRSAAEQISAMNDNRGGVLALAKSVGDDWKESIYYDLAEKDIDWLWDGIVWPILKSCDLSLVIDIAAGHGRNTRKLLEAGAGVVIVSDINIENIEFCRRRFAKDPRVSYLLTNGVQLAGLADASITTVYSFDAMVHFDSDVIRSYLREFRRVLRPGGRAFLHHSNFSGLPTSDFRVAPSHWRNFMSKELFAHYAVKEGLLVVEQHLVDWGGVRHLDCVSLLAKP